MHRKLKLSIRAILGIALSISGSGMAAVESSAAGLAVDLPVGWSADPHTPHVAVLASGPAGARLALAREEVEPEAAAVRLRESLTAMTAGLRILDDDTIPLGGRTWRRQRVSFASGGTAWQQAWFCGSVGGRTTTVILSAPAATFDAQYQAATAAIATIRPFAAW
jgi:hypothetical protein